MKLVLRGGRILFVVLAVCIVCRLGALAPQLIKNTTLLESAKSEKKLPVWLKYGIPFGMVFIETHIVENYTRYAPEGTATSKLLRELFNIKAGEFRIPDPQINTAGNYITPQMMGKIIRLIFESSKKDLFLNKINEIKPEISRFFEKRLRGLDPEFSERSFKNFFRGSFKKFATFLANSLEECNYWGNNKTPIYAPHTTLYLLYGFVYKKTKDRADLKKFLDALCGEDFGLQKDLEQYFPNQKTSLNQRILDNANPSREKNWLTDSYDLKSLATQKIELQVSSIDIEKLLAMGIAQNWIVFNMPPMCDYGLTESKKYPFVAASSDCVRTTIRSICNIFAFDEHTQLFSTKKLLENFPGANKDLQNFYSTYPGQKLHDKKMVVPYTAAELQSDELRTAWSDNVIRTNIPYATYGKLYTKTGMCVKNVSRGTGRFAICLPDNSSLLKNKSINKDGFYEKAVKIDSFIYDAFTPSSGLLGFGFASYTHTLIFVLDHLLGLKLFNGVIIDEELIKPDFEKTYMEKFSHIPPFKKIVSNIRDSFGIHDVTTHQNQTFLIGLQNGLHAYVKATRITGGGEKIWAKLSKNTSYNEYIAPEISLFIAHVINVKPELSGILGQSFLFRGDWSLNEAKIDAIIAITDHLQLEKYYGKEKEYREMLSQKKFKSSWDVSAKGYDTCSRDDKSFYLEVIKNILESLNFAVGDYDLCTNIIKNFKVFFYNNKAFKEIVFNDLRNKLLKQTAGTGDNILMVAVKSGNLGEVKRVTEFIKASRDKQLIKQLCEQTNKKGETASAMAKKAKKLAREMGNADIEAIGDIKDEIDDLC